MNVFNSDIIDHIGHIRYLYIYHFFSTANFEDGWPVFSLKGSGEQNCEGGEVEGVGQL